MYSTPLPEAEAFKVPALNSAELTRNKEFVPFVQVELAPEPVTLAAAIVSLLVIV